MMSKHILYRRWGKYHEDKRNWKTYNSQLVRRGELYISLEFLDNWDNELKEMNKKKMGRRFIYPEKFIKWTALIYHTMNMPYRTMEGFLRQLSRYIPRLKAADYTTLFRRIRDVKIDLKDSIPRTTRPIVIAVDSSEIQISPRGEWRNHKWRMEREPRGWVEIHMAVDARRKEIVGLNITDESVGEPSGFEPPLENCNRNIGIRKISKVLADGGYDRHKTFNYLGWYGIKSGIKLRRNAKPSKRFGSDYRNKCLCRKDKIGYEAWKDEVEYTLRWSSGCVFSCVKRMLGESVRSKSKESALRDSCRKFVIYNVLKNYGKEKISRF